MTLSKPPKVLLQPRDRALLETASTLGVLDREGAKRIGPFNSTTRANARLLALTRMGFLKRVFLGTIAGGRKAVYFPPGRRRSLTARRASAIAYLEHQLAVASVYHAFRYSPGARGAGADWTTFSAPLVPGSRLIPDALLVLHAPADTTPMFVEADQGTEALSIWRMKASKYLELALGGHHRAICGPKPFRVLVVTEGERRCRSLARVVGSVTDKLFWFTTRHQLESHGPYARIWLRPGEIKDAVSLPEASSDDK